MVKIALLRHAQTDWNSVRRLQGRVDRPLTASARTMLAEAAPPPLWAHARVVASPLRRAQDTARALWAEVETDPRLTELDWGDWEGRVGADLLADPTSGFRPVEEWGWDARPPGGESPREAWERVAPLLAELARDGRPTVLVAHRGLMRVILARAWRWDFDRPEPFEIRRGALLPLRLGPDGAPGAPGPAEPLARR